MASGNSGNSRAAIFLGLALIASLAATVAIWQLMTYYERQINEAQKPGDMVTVVIAAREIFPGVQITEEDIWEIQVAPGYLPGREQDWFSNTQAIVGATPRERILPNEFIRTERLANKETGAGLNALLPRGMRAISIGIKDGAALSGLVRPGDYVDVVVTIYPEEGDKAPETRTLVQVVPVLAVNDKMEEADKPDEDPKAKKKKAKGAKKVKPTVTLMVDASEAEQVAHAEKKGDITLVLRNAQDLEFKDRGEGTRISDLGVGGLPEPPPAPEPTKVAVVKKATPVPVAVPEAETQTLQIVRGDKSTTQTVDKATGDIEAGKTKQK